MIFKNSISIIYRAPSTFWLTWYAPINHTNSWWRPGNMLSRRLLLVYLWYVPDMLLVCSRYDSGTFWYIGCFIRSCEAEWELSCNHPTSCSRQHSFPQSYCCSHQQRDPPWEKEKLHGPANCCSSVVAASPLLPPQAKSGVPVLPLVAANIKIEHTTALPRNGLNNRIKYSHCWDVI